MKRFILPLLALISISLSAQPVPSDDWSVQDNVIMRLNRKDGIYAKGDTVRVWADVTGTPKPGLVLKTMRWCQWDAESRNEVELHEGENLLVERVFDESVQYVFEVTDGVKPNDFPSTGNAFAGLVVAPEEFRSGFAAPADFRKFWKKEIKAMRRQKMEVQVSKDTISGGFRTYHVDISCIGPAPVRAYVSYPVDARKKSLPIIIFYHAAGRPGAPSSARTARHYAGLVEGGAIGIDINAHGMLDDQPQDYYDSLSAGPLKGYSSRIPVMGDYYFKWMMLRAVRIVDYAVTNPLWDGKHIIVSGGSQGGYQSAWVAGVDSRITTAVLTVPAGMDQGATLQGRPASWPKTMDRYPEESSSVLPYFDPATFLRNTKADIWCEIGLYDFTCPAANLFAVMNTVTSPKTIVTVQRPHSRLNARCQAEHEKVDSLSNAYIQKAATK